MFFKDFHQLVNYKKRDAIYFINENVLHLGKSHFKTLHKATVDKKRECFFWHNLAKPWLFLGWVWCRDHYLASHPGLSAGAGGSVH